MKVCILASGIGSRISQFDGRVHKALLPLGNLAVISRIIGQFPVGTDFVVTLGHLADQVRDYLAIMHPGLPVQFVTVDPFTGPGAGPGYSLWCCREVLDAPFYLTACDTLLTTPPPPLDGNVMAVCAVDDPSLWCTLELDGAGQVTRLHYKSAQGTPHAFVGFAAVHDHAAFWAGLEPKAGSGGEHQVDDGFSALIPHGLRTALSGWIDSGTDENYAAALARFGANYSFEGKSTDVTYRLGDQVVKFFPHGDAARRRFERGLANPAFARPIACVGQFFSYRFAEGAMLSALQGANTCAAAMDWLETHFWRDESIDPNLFEAACRRFYGDKTLGRLQDYLRRFDDGAEVDDLTINGRPCRTVAQAVTDLPASFWTSALPSTFHGDLHDDNMVVTADGGLTLIDWRQDFAGLPLVGDRYYDLAKYFHTLDLCVATMAGGGYRLGPGVTAEHDDTPALAEAREAFWRFCEARGYDRRRIELLNGLIFVNMAPFYAKDMADYLYHLGRLRLEEALA